MNIKQRVKNALTRVPALRDDLNLLVTLMWRTDLKEEGKFLDKMTAAELMDEIAKGQLTNYRTIQRWWSKTQEDCEELRGEKYNYRNNIEEPKVREEIKQTNMQEV